VHFAQQLLEIVARTQGLQVVVILHFVDVRVSLGDGLAQKGNGAVGVLRLQFWGNQTTGQIASQSQQSATPKNSPVIPPPNAIDAAASPQRFRTGS
jgi:hypothetical protein